MSSTRCETVRSSRHRLCRLARSCCRWAPGSVRCCVSTPASMRSGPSSLGPSPQVAQTSSARRTTCSTSAVEAASWWAAGVAAVSPWAPAATLRKGHRDPPSGSALAADPRWAAAAPAASPVARRYSAG
eukprot:scaffold24914_cov70-Phaeocystis_antarctica.AAC.5